MLDEKLVFWKFGVCRVYSAENEVAILERSLRGVRLEDAFI